MTDEARHRPDEERRTNAAARSGITRAVLVCLIGTAIWIVASATVSAFTRGGISAGLSPLDAFWQAMLPGSSGTLQNTVLLLALVAMIQRAVYWAARKNREAIFLATIFVLSTGGSFVVNRLMMQ